MGNGNSSNTNVSDQHQRRSSADMSHSALSITSRSNKAEKSSSNLAARLSITPATATATNSGHQLSKLAELPQIPESSPPLQLSLQTKSCNSVISPSSTHKRKRSSLIIVHNGITGEYISSRICKIAARFWQHHIDTLSVTEQLEIGCSIFFSMMASNSKMKKIMKTNNNNIEKTSLKYLDMMGWLIRHLITDNIDLYALLTKLGLVHQQIGINIKHFDPMLQSMHETFSYYFENEYTIEIKYAMDEIFSLAAQVMTGQELKFNSHLNNITQQFKGNEIQFLANLETCLKSSIGREYFYRYLAQTWCDEIAIFLKNLYRFKKQMSDKERFMVAREITKSSIQPTATFCLNLSYENRVNAINKMKATNERFLSKETFEVSTDFFADVERETYKLIMDNHWKKFVHDIETLQAKSFNVE